MPAGASGLSIRQGVVATGTRGRMRVERVALSNGENLPSDAVLMCGGWIFVVHLFSQSRGKLGFDEQRQAFLPDAWSESVRSAGACNGTVGLDACMEEGFSPPAIPMFRCVPAPSALKNILIAAVRPRLSTSRTMSLRRT